MRIGIDASNIRAGGGITHLSEVLSAANPETVGVDQIIVWGGRKTLERLPRQDWLSLIHVPLLDGAFPYRLFWQRELLANSARRECDVLFTPGGTHAGGFAPFVTMSQNLLPFEPTERRRFAGSAQLRYVLLERAQTKAFRSASGVIFLTETARQTVLQRTGMIKGQTIVIPHGISDRFRRKPTKQLDIDHYTESKPFRLLYVSIINVYKHQWIVAEAVSQLRHKGLPITIDFVGPAYPPALRRLQKVMARVDPTNTFIRYLGAIPFSDLPAVYHSAHGFVFASSCENMPNILIEAMASGLPIACSNRGPMPEVLDNAGIYFDPEKTDEVASSIEQLMQDRHLREQYAFSAYERSQQYTWDRCADQTIRYLSKLDFFELSNSQTSYLSSQEKPLDSDGG